MGAYTLMHKDIPVAELNIDEPTGSLLRIKSTINKEHLPVGTVVSGFLDGNKIRNWWSRRSIPASRSGIEHLLESLDCPGTTMLLTKSLGLSLSDQYWVRPHGSNLTWKDINFFENDFSEDVGNLLFGIDVDVGSIDLSSPDNTSDGVLRKKWKIIDGKRCLLKGGGKTFMQEPYNEVMASRIASALDIPHVEYSMLIDTNIVCSVCEDFVTEETELVSAYHVMSTIKRANNVSLYDHYVRCCTDFGVDVVRHLDRMLVLDYVICNSDRHTNNFGLVRNADTLEWIGPAPVFDSGSSLGHETPSMMIRSTAPISCKPFMDTFDRQIELVSDFGWIDFDALHAAIDECSGIVEGVWDGSDPGRDSEIIGLMRDQAERLEAIARRK